MNTITDAERIGALSLTENLGLTYSTTLVPCVDFYFDVLQRTEKEVIENKLALAWSADPLLTLKLVFQLRDIRKGKGAQPEFYHSLIWVYNNHPATFFANLEHVPRHGYWKDLYQLVKFIAYNHVCMKTGVKREPKYHRNNPRKAAGSDSKHITPSMVSVKELAKRRLKGEVCKKELRGYFIMIDSDPKRKAAREEYQLIISELQDQLAKTARAEQKAKQKEVLQKISDLRQEDTKFNKLYTTVVELTAGALRENRRLVEQNQVLPSTELCAKWVPTIGCSIDKATLLGSSIAQALYPELEHKGPEETNKMYHIKIKKLFQKEYLTPLRKAICVPETFMSANAWNHLKYERVPSVCMKQNKKHFMKHDEDRFKGFLEKVKQGEKKIASGALMPHQIVKEILESSTDLQQVTQLQWNSYVSKLKQFGMLTSALAICDVSGSMSGIPMQVAIALSLLIAELSAPPFNGYICTFSENPQIQLVNQPTLVEKVQFVSQMDWGMNTNVQAVFDLVLEMARGIDLPADKMIKTLFIFSDMEFDACGANQYQTDYEIICNKFQQYGYTVPAIVFWNLRGGERSKPVLANQLNVAMVSGFSGQMMKTFLENGTFPNPYETMLATLGSHYDHLKVVD